MRLDQWRAFMGWDKASAVDKHAVASLNPETWGLKLTVGTRTLRAETRPIEGIDIDFVGGPLPKQDAIVGPFQNLKRGENRYSVWPIRTTE